MQQLGNNSSFDDLGERHLTRGVELPAVLRGDGVRGEANLAPALHSHQPYSQVSQASKFLVSILDVKVSFSVIKSKPKNIRLKMGIS